MPSYLPLRIHNYFSGVSGALKNAPQRLKSSFDRGLQSGFVCTFTNAAGEVAYLASGIHADNKTRIAAAAVAILACPIAKGWLGDKPFNIDKTKFAMMAIAVAGGGYALSGTGAEQFISDYAGGTIQWGDLSYEDYVSYGEILTGGLITASAIDNIRGNAVRSAKLYAASALPLMAAAFSQSAYGGGVDVGMAFAATMFFGAGITMKDIRYDVPRVSLP